MTRRCVCLTPDEAGWRQRKPEHLKSLITDLNAQLHGSVKTKWDTETTLSLFCLGVWASRRCWPWKLSGKLRRLYFRMSLYQPLVCTQADSRSLRTLKVSSLVSTLHPSRPTQQSSASMSDHHPWLTARTGGAYHIRIARPTKSFWHFPACITVLSWFTYHPYAILATQEVGI